MCCDPQIQIQRGIQAQIQTQKHELKHKQKSRTKISVKIGNGAVPGELGRCKQDAINDMVLLLLMMQLKVFIQVRIPGLNTNTVVLITDKGVYLGNNRGKGSFHVQAQTQIHFLPILRKSKGL